MKHTSVFLIIFLSVFYGVKSQTPDTSVKVLLLGQINTVKISIPKIGEYTSIKYLTTRQNKLTIKEEIDAKMQRTTTLEIIPGETPVVIEVQGIRKKDNKTEKIATYQWGTMSLPKFEPYWIIEQGNQKDTISYYRQTKPNPAIRFSKNQDSINIYFCPNCINCTSQEVLNSIYSRIGISKKAGVGGWSDLGSKHGKGNNPFSLDLYGITRILKTGSAISLECNVQFDLFGERRMQDIPLNQRTIILVKQ